MTDAKNDEGECNEIPARSVKPSWNACKSKPSQATNYDWFEYIRPPWRAHDVKLPWHVEGEACEYHQNTECDRGYSTAVLKKKTRATQQKDYSGWVNQNRDRRHPRDYRDNLMAGGAEQCLYADSNYRERKEDSTNALKHWFNVINPPR
ncbi:MAG TPA: hypothetical protein VKS98_08685 [Chthoniobacterales bacterium]|nr:hypothetical protein [Chthoniobacterales bacterium]